MQSMKARLRAPLDRVYLELKWNRTRMQRSSVSRQEKHLAVLFSHHLQVFIKQQRRWEALLGPFPSLVIKLCQCSRCIQCALVLHSFIISLLISFLAFYATVTRWSKLSHPLLERLENFPFSCRGSLEAVGILNARLPVKRRKACPWSKGSRHLRLSICITTWDGTLSQNKRPGRESRGASHVENESNCHELDGLRVIACSCLGSVMLTIFVLSFKTSFKKAVQVTCAIVRNVRRHFLW